MLCMHLVLSSCVIIASYQDKETKDFLKTLDKITSVQVGFKGNDFFITAEEKPSLWRRAIGMKGVQHKIKTPIFQTLGEQYRSQSSRSQPMRMDRSLDRRANNEERDNYSCCLVATAICCAICCSEDSDKD